MPGTRRTDRITGVILAGGAAQRLNGRDKGLVPWRGQALVQSVLCVLAAQVDELLIVANRNIAEYAKYAPVVSDQHPGFRGPMEGIASALRATQTQRILIVPVDCPEPPGNLAARLSQEPSYNIVARVAHDGSRRQPLFALYDASLLQSAERAATSGTAVWRWQDMVGAQEVDFSDCNRCFHNLNLPADFEEGTIAP